ncbi:hypothetical protein DL770_008336 [Monosporascus sp. CRB-9-2]|nr:hypothetical protein DL770_008336 [Monosporascus sp. CRB-9-2]
MLHECCRISHERESHKRLEAQPPKKCFFAQPGGCLTLPEIVHGVVAGIFNTTLLSSARKQAATARRRNCPYQMDPNAVFYPWYRGDGQPVANDAFKAVKEHFEQSSSLNDQEKALVASTSRIEDVLQVVADSLAKYEAKILDIFVQHHPEYVSLVWATMKLVFVSVQNHGETLKLLAKSVSQVAQMRLAVESLYTCILEFLCMAHAWCNESKFRHFYHSFTRPHELRYNDLLERVTDCSNNIVELAAVSSQAEIHVMHKTQARKLDDIISTLKVADKDRKNQLDGITYVVSRLEASDRKQEKKLDLIISLLEASGLTINDLLAKTESKYPKFAKSKWPPVLTYPAFHSIQTSAQLNTNQQLSELQLSQVLSTFSLTFEDPGKCYKRHLFFRNRRASGMGANTSTSPFWLSLKLARWSSSHESSLAIIKGAFTSRLSMLDFGVDVIQTLTASAVLTVWALTSVEKSRSDSISTTTDLMKYLTYQALRLRGAVKTEKQMASRYSQLHTARTPEEWLELFKQVVANLGGQVYLVVDLATVRSSLEGTDRFNFIQELSRMLSDVSKHGMETKVKVVLLVYEADWFRFLPNDRSSYIIPVKAIRSKRPQGKEMRHAVKTRVFPAYRGGHGRVRGG